jgi:hypothetical protein
VALTAFVGAPAPEALGAEGYTLIVSPARYSVLQVCFDVVQRESAVLVSYQGESSTEEPRLHAWNGFEWSPVSLQDFREASFLEQTPIRTILIGDEKTLPSVIAGAATWAAETATIKDLTSSALVNEFGRIFDWTPSDWKWFAARYNLELQDESESLRNSSWYDQHGPLYRDPSKSIFSRDGGGGEGAYEAPPAADYSIEPAVPAYDAGSAGTIASEPMAIEYQPAAEDAATIK